MNGCFKEKLGIDNPYLNVFWGVKALARYPGDRIRTLKKYNAEFSWAYYHEICRIEKLIKGGRE